MINKVIDFLLNILLEYIWNNLILLRIFFVLLIIILYLIFSKKKEIYSIFFPHNYNDLCLKIGTILNKNKNLWREFGPNSSFDSVNDPMRQDLKLWENIKTKEILPNNKIIRRLIENNEKIISTTDKLLFVKMSEHIMAFEAHSIDNTIDYRKYQFPIEFEKLIYSKCEYLNRKQIDKISKWLKQRILNKNFSSIKIKSIWIYGSILKGQYSKVDDVDILILSNISAKDDYFKLINLLSHTEKEFMNKFKKKINITLFTKNEEQGYLEFIKLIDSKREL